jgi:general secretion pathway protein J
MIPPSDREAGFTLLEVLMAGAILAAVVALMLPVVRIASQAEDRSREMAERRNDHSGLEQVMRELLWQAQSAPDGLEGSRFSGDAGSVSFLARPEGNERLYQVSLSLEAEGVGVSLSPLPDGPAHSSTFPLSSSQWRFHYYGDPEDGAAPVWSERWDKSWMPRLLVLDMTDEDGQVRRIETLVGGQAPIDCEYDSGQGICLGADY